jgi:hypothetical protein
VFLVNSDQTCWFRFGLLWFSGSLCGQTDAKRKGVNRTRYAGRNHEWHMATGAVLHRTAYGQFPGRRSSKQMNVERRASLGS